MLALFGLVLLLGGIVSIVYGVALWSEKIAWIIGGISAIALALGVAELSRRPS
jgi:uncharacterized membrane protein HdeD (DUF308 family)